MVYDIVQGQENRPMSYRSRKIGIRQKSSGHRGDLCFLGRRLKMLVKMKEKSIEEEKQSGQIDKIKAG